MNKDQLDDKELDFQPPPPGTGVASYADRRKQFEQLSDDSLKDSNAVRAFLTSKIELILSDPGLSEQEKDRARGPLERRLRAVADSADSASG
jgi:hypothetical protein